MDNARAQHTPYPLDKGTVEEQGIHQCSRIITRSRMDNHTGRFIDYNCIRIFKNDI